jgi:hypothetical protein
VPTLSLGLLLFLSWTMTRGDAWALPVGALVMSFAVQTHVGYGIVGPALLAWGALALAVGVWRRGRRRAEVSRLWKAALIAGVILAVVWTPPLVQQFTGDPGNLGRVAEYMRSANDLHTLGEGYRVMTSQLGSKPDWVVGNKRFPGLTLDSGASHAPLLFGLFLVAMLVLAWRRNRDGLLLGATVMVAVVAGVVSVARVNGPLFGYLVRWTWTVGFAVGVVVAWGAIELVRAIGTQFGGRRSRRLATALLAMGVLAATAFGTREATRARMPWAPETRALAQLIPPTLEHLSPADGPVTIRGAAPMAGTYAPAIVIALERKDILVGMGKSVERAYGPRRVRRARHTRTTLWLAGAFEAEQLESRPDLRFVARADLLPRRELLVRGRALRNLDAALAEGRIPNDEYLKQRGAALAGTQMVVFVQKAGATRSAASAPPLRA